MKSSTIKTKENNELAIRMHAYYFDIKTNLTYEAPATRLRTVSCVRSWPGWRRNRGGAGALARTRPAPCVARAPSTTSCP